MDAESFVEVGIIVCEQEPWEFGATNNGRYSIHVLEKCGGRMLRYDASYLGI